MYQSRHDADSCQRVEVITDGRRRRDWSDEEKARILSESPVPDVSISEVARRNGVSRGLLDVWRRQARLASAGRLRFAQVRLEGAVEAQPVAVDRARDLASAIEAIEVVIAGAMDDDVVGNIERAGSLMAAGAVADQHGGRAWRDVGADLDQMQAHAFGVDGRRNERRADAARIAPNM